MKTLKKLFAASMLLLVLAAFTACDDGSDSSDGSGDSSTGTTSVTNPFSGHTFEGNNYKWEFTSATTVKLYINGTYLRTYEYTFTGTTITFLENGKTEISYLYKFDAAGNLLYDSIDGGDDYDTLYKKS